MSLRVWLPLNGDLHNQGNSGIIATHTGATIDNNGKIGKCYYLSGSTSSYIDTGYSTNIGTSDFTLAMWVKIPTITSGSYYAVCTSKKASAAGSGFGIYWNYTQKKFLWSTADGTNATEIWMATAVDSLVYDKWIHLVMVRESADNKKGYFYINGVRYDLASVPAIRDITTDTKLLIGKCTNNHYPIKAYYNDFRIYDHALSPLEVKEISQGLVLHYPLNGYLGSAPNLLSKYVIPGKGAPGSTSTGGRTNYYGNYGIIIPATEKADTYFRLFLNKQLESGKTYTISCNVDGLLSGSYYRFPLFAQSNTSMGVLDLNHNGLCSLTFTMNWTGTQTAVSKDGRNIYVCFLDDSGRTIASGQGPITVTNFKIEEGSVVTPFSPDFYDVGLDTTKIIDCSGFGNNGTITGSLNYTSDSQRYNVSTYFNGSTYIHLAPPTTEIKTFSVWANWDSIPSGQSVILVDNGSQIGLGLMSTGILCSTSGAGNSYTFSKSSLVANTWYHFVVVETGTTTRKLYINGVEQTPTSNTSNWTYSVNELQLGKRSTTSDGFVGKLSDFRAYATALSEADIKALYNTSANVDNLGNFHSFEFVETNNNLVNSDLTTWNKESNVTCAFNSTTGFYDVDTHRDSSITSCWGIYKDIAITPSTNYVFAVDMKDSNSKMYAGTYTSTPSGLPSSYSNVSSTTKRYYSYFTSGSSDIVCRLYLCATPSTNTVGHFVNPYFGVVSTNKSIRKNGIADFGNIVELNNERARISQFGELGANEFIEK